jgi:hypothetical protein
MRLLAIGWMLLGLGSGALAVAAHRKPQVIEKTAVLAEPEYRPVAVAPRVSALSPRGYEAPIVVAPPVGAVVAAPSGPGPVLIDPEPEDVDSDTGAILDVEDRCPGVEEAGDFDDYDGCPDVID